MPTPTKTANGKWKLRGCWTVNGTKHRKLFTADRKADVMQLYYDYAAKIERQTKLDLTVSEALEEYVDLRAKTLSPATIKEYARLIRVHTYRQIENVRLSQLNTVTVQRWVSEYGENRSEKSTRNAYGLLIAAVRLYDPAAVFNVVFRRTEKTVLHCPTDSEVMTLYNAASDRLRLCIALSAFAGGLRRGEISALTYADLTDGYLYVHRDMVQNAEGKWILKEVPKTSDSVRRVPVPSAVLDLIGNGEPTERIVEWYPNTITARFNELRRSVNLEYIRFHDLRAYFASSSALVMPDFYTAKLGGWAKSSKALKNIYQRTQADQQEKFFEDLNKKFDDVLKKK